MFEPPGAKRVRRNEILSRASSSRSPSPASESAAPDAHRLLGELLNLDEYLAPATAKSTNTQKEATQSQTDEAAEEAEEQEFEFRLFSAPAPRKLDTTGAVPASTGAASEATQAKAQADTQRGGTQKLRIRLRSPSPGEVGLEDGRFVNPSRGWEYYFTTPALLPGNGVGDEVQTATAALKRKQYEEAAVTGDQMIGWAQVPWPGCSLPWRVINLKRHQTKLPRSSGTEASASAIYVVEPADRIPKSRKKPGKKRRLQLRKRLTAAEEAKKAEAEKRNRKNRERKIKRRQKAREMKAAAAAAQGQDAPAVEMDEDSSSQDEGD
ncbi:hypothetical protein BDV59DRAFT_128806 [Aspergillus ambiguus]|uniref:DUF2011 domain-containing protein n=1 Tax=Aspergillus ambiguus TaxID=176160 RepID=UPI003CCD1E44